VFIISMYFGGGIIPYFILLKSIHLYNTFLVYIIPGMFATFNCILMMNFFREIPASLEESAKIDGAGDIRVFFQIIIPVSLPVIATISLFNGVGHWNDWYTTAFFTVNRSLRTAAYELREIINMADLTSVQKAIGATQETGSQTLDRATDQKTAQYTAETIRMATMVVTVFPITAIYPFLQKYFVKGIMIGSIKG